MIKLLRADAVVVSAEAMRQGIRAGTFTSPHLKLVNPSQLVYEVLRTSGPDMLLQIFRTVDDAVSTF